MAATPGIVNPILELQAFIDERWTVAQPEHYPGVAEGPRAHSELTPSEAAYFLACVASHGVEPPLITIDDERKMRSDRIPPTAKGAPRGYHFFDEIDRNHLRLETIVEMAAMARLHFEFGWPREYLICESPTVTKDGTDVLRYDALDILLLEAPCTELAAKMTIAEVRPRVAVEAKADPKLLGKLVDEMRTCQAADAPGGHQEHNKCIAVAELRPQLLLGVAAGETWRLFTVAERDGRAVLGDELPNLNDLHFSPTTEHA